MNLSRLKIENRTKLGGISKAMVQLINHFLNKKRTGCRLLFYMFINVYSRYQYLSTLGAVLVHIRDGYVPVLVRLWDGG